MSTPLRTVWKSVRKTDIYQRAKSSWVYDAYWSIADKSIVASRQKEIAFYRSVLTRFHEGDLIFDVGANVGSKSAIFLEMGARVVAVEPDESCQRILSQRFLRYRFAKKPIVIVPKAVSDKASVVQMWVGSPSSAFNTLSSKWADTLRDDESRVGEKLKFDRCTQVEATTLHDLITEYGSPIFAKIDVEGYELSVLRGLREPIPCLSFEINLPEFRQEGIECVRCLNDLWPDGLFNFTADCCEGLKADTWLPMGQFLQTFADCNDPSIEVFWKRL